MARGHPKRAGAPDRRLVEARDPYRRAAQRGAVAQALLVAQVLVASLADRVVPPGPAMRPDRAAVARVDKEVSPGREAAAPVV